MTAPCWTDHPDAPGDVLQLIVGDCQALVLRHYGGTDWSWELSRIIELNGQRCISPDSPLHDAPTRADAIRAAEDELQARGILSAHQRAELLRMAAPPPAG